MPAFDLLASPSQGQAAYTPASRSSHTHSILDRLHAAEDQALSQSRPAHPPLQPQLSGAPLLNAVMAAKGRPTSFASLSAASMSAPVSVPESNDCKVEAGAPTDAGSAAGGVDGVGSGVGMWKWAQPVPLPLEDMPSSSLQR